MVPQRAVLQRRFYERIDDFKSKVLLYSEPGYEVYRAKCAYSGGIVVLKGYGQDILTPENRERVVREVDIMQGSECPFLTKCFDAFEDQGWWWVVMESCAGGDLYHLCQRCPASCRDEAWLVSQVVLPLLQTLAYLHEQGVVHRDVKPENVLFNSEKVAKLGGFFLCWDLAQDGPPLDVVGTLDYIAPEVFRLMSSASQPYDHKVDIWATGVLVYDILMGRPPFQEGDHNQTVNAILNSVPTIPEHVSPEARDFLLLALTKNPEDRPDAGDLLNHDWVMDYLDWEPPEGFEDPIPPMSILNDCYTDMLESQAGELRGRCWPLSSVLSPSGGGKVVPQAEAQGGVMSAMRQGLSFIRQRLWAAPGRRSDSQSSAAMLLYPAGNGSGKLAVDKAGLKRIASKVNTDAIQLANGALRVELTPTTQLAKKMASFKDASHHSKSLKSDRNADNDELCIPAGHPTQQDPPPKVPALNFSQLTKPPTKVEPISPVHADHTPRLPQPDPTTPKPSAPDAHLPLNSPPAPRSPTGNHPPFHSIDLLSLTTPHAIPTALAPTPSPPTQTAPLAKPLTTTTPPSTAGPQNILIIPDSRPASATITLPEPIPSAHPSRTPSARGNNKTRAVPWLSTDPTWQGGQPAGPDSETLVLPIQGSSRAGSRMASARTRNSLDIAAAKAREAVPPAGADAAPPAPALEQLTEYNLEAILNDDD